MLSDRHRVRTSRSTKETLVLVALYTYIVRTMAFGGWNWRGRNKRLLANVQQLDYNVLGLQEAGR